MPIEFKTYKEYLADEAEASKEHVGDHRFVAGCTNPPPYYKVGDVRGACQDARKVPGLHTRQAAAVRSEVQAMKKCIICGKQIVGYGNNPEPVRRWFDGPCCDECNREKVIPARLKLATGR